MASPEPAERRRPSKAVVFVALAPLAVAGVVVGMVALLLDQRILTFSSELPTSLAASQAVILTIVAAILLVIAISVLVTAVRRTDGAFGAAAYLTAVGIPFTAAVYTIGAYAWITPGPRLMLGSAPDTVSPLREEAVPLGVIATFVTWVAAAWLLRRFATAERANEGLYGELQSRLSRLERWTRDWPPMDAPATASTDPTRSSAIVGWQSLVQKVTAVAITIATFVVATLVRAGAKSLVAPLHERVVTRRPDPRGYRCSKGCCSACSESPRDGGVTSEQSEQSCDRAKAVSAVNEVESANAKGEAAWTEATAHACAIRHALGQPGDFKAGLSWVTGQGYIDCWRRVHRAEEALIAVAPPYQLARWVNNDDLRLQAANIPTAASLKAKLRAAAKELDLQDWVSSDGEAAPVESPADPKPSPERVPGSAGMAAALKKSAKANAELLALARDIEASNADARSAEENERAKRDARAAVAEVRSTINDYRDELWAGMLRQRNHLLRMALFTGVTAYFFVVLAVLVRVPPPNLTAAAVFYLVGALAGLFATINRDAPADAAVEDYGLSAARLIHTRLLSGLAGVGGVVLAAFLAPIFMVSITAGSLDAGPSPSPSAGAAQTVVTASPVPGNPENGNGQGRVHIDLSKTFRLPDNTFGLLVAAVFGLTPNLLVRRLDAQAKQWSADLNSSESTGTGTAPAATQTL